LVAVKVGELVWVSVTVKVEVDVGLLVAVFARVLVLVGLLVGVEVSVSVKVYDTAWRADNQARFTLEGHKLGLHISAANEQYRTAQRMVP